MTDSDPLIGKILAHYRVLEKIGEGGMGVVYKARDLHLDRLVALKTLPAEKLDDVVRRQRFVQEVTKNGGFAAAETVDGKYLYYTPACCRRYDETANCHTRIMKQVALNKPNRLA